MLAGAILGFTNCMGKSGRDKIGPALNQLKKIVIRKADAFGGIDPLMPFELNIRAVLQSNFQRSDCIN